MDRESLRYVCESVGHPLNPILSNLYIYAREDGRQRAQAQNGRFTIDVPTDLPTMMVNAARLNAVWSVCDSAPKASIGKDHVTISQGRMRARIALLDPTGYPRERPDPPTDHSVEGLSTALKALMPFVATDAARPWATSVCLAEDFAYATNNVVIARCPLRLGLKRHVNVPGSSLESLLVQDNFAAIGAGESSVTFYLEGDIWVKTQMVAGDWPIETVNKLLDGLNDNWLQVNPNLGAMLSVAAKLADDRHPIITFESGAIRLEDESLIAEDLEPVPASGKVNARMAALVFEHATQVQWHTPKENVHAFSAGMITGAFGGQR